MKEINPFDFVKSVTYTKTDLFEHIDKYVPFIVNRALSFNLDCILECNEMNVRPWLDKRSQYRFYLNKITRKKRYAKWVKNVKGDDLQAVIKYYGYNNEKALIACKLLTEEQLKHLKRITSEAQYD